MTGGVNIDSAGRTEALGPGERGTGRGAPVVESGPSNNIFGSKGGLIQTDSEIHLCSKKFTH